MNRYSTIKRTCKVFAFFAIISCISAVPSFAADVKGSKDHPLVSRYDGSNIMFYKADAFNEYALFINDISTNKGIKGQPDSVKWIEGRITRLLYVNPPDRSSLEVFRNYENALKSAGFETIYSCKKKTCGGYEFNRAMNPYMWMTYNDQRYLAAKLSREEGDVYVSLYVTPSGAGGGKTYQRTLTQLQVIDVEPMQENMVTVDSEAMNKGLGEEGRVALYGILFDLDKDTIKPESKATLEQISALLTNNPEMKIVIVGHTDSQGDIKYNMDLSTRRAKSVEAALIGNYGIAKERLSAWGVGYLSPVASNRNESGRKKNRRVELVEN